MVHGSGAWVRDLVYEELCVVLEVREGDGTGVRCNKDVVAGEPSA